jgi:membrane protein DedA with SNARE-associated domain
MRLPLFLTMGFLRVPFGRFITITGITAVVWTAAIFAAAWKWGPTFLPLVARSRLALGITLGIVAGLFCLLRFRKPRIPIAGRED